MPEDFFAGLAEEAAADMSRVPSDEKIARLRKMGQQFFDLQATRDDLEKRLKDANVALYEMRMKTMPELMAELRTDSIGLPGANVDIVAKPYYHANIAADWDDEKKEAAFAHIDEMGGGDIIKTTITIFFGRDQHDQMTEWLEKVRGLNLSFEPPEMRLGRAVQWNTLTAWVREQWGKVRGADEPKLDLEKLGATVGTEAVIKPRK